MSENNIICSQKSNTPKDLILDADSQPNFGFYDNSSKQLDIMSSKLPEEEVGDLEQDRVLLDSQPKERIGLELDNEDPLSDQKEQLDQTDQIDQIQSAKKSTNVDSNLRNEQILEDQEMEPLATEQFQKNFEKEALEPAVSESNRTLENEHPNQAVKREEEIDPEVPAQPVEITNEINGKHSLLEF